MRIPLLLFVVTTGLCLSTLSPAQDVSPERLASLLQRFPDADTDQDGILSLQEAEAFRNKLRKSNNATRRMTFHPGWDEERFPEHAVRYRSPEEIAAIYAEVIGDPEKAVVSFPETDDGVLRIVGTGHSFMNPGYKALRQITHSIGFDQPLYTHTGGGMTGSTRYKWEEENGIFQFEGQPNPKLLASIANAEWDAMTWGPYVDDRPEFYSCWMDFCLQFHPHMKFYLSDSWPQLSQLETLPASEEELTAEVFERMNAERLVHYEDMIGILRESYPDKVFVMPTSNAMTIAAKAFIRGELPGVEGLHTFVGGEPRSLWRDKLGHLGPGFGNLEGYVFYAALYGRSPELIEGDVNFQEGGRYPSRELDRVFRQIAWEAVITHPLSGVTDEDGDGIRDK